VVALAIETEQGHSLFLATRQILEDLGKDLLERRRRCRSNKVKASGRRWLVSSMSPFWQIDTQIDEFRRPFREPVNTPISLYLWRLWIDELIDQADSQFFSDNGAPPRHLDRGGRRL
jgi:hypothetical protein